MEVTRAKKVKSLRTICVKRTMDLCTASHIQWTLEPPFPQELVEEIVAQFHIERSNCTPGYLDGLYANFFNQFRGADIKRIAFHNGTISLKCINSVLEHYPNVRELSFSSLWIDELEGDPLERFEELISQNKSLVSFIWRHDCLESPSRWRFVFCLKLEKLVLKHVGAFENIDTSGLFKMPMGATLKHFELEVDRENDHIQRNLVDISNLKRIEVLILRNALTDFATALPVLAELKTLRDLDISWWYYPLDAAASPSDLEYLVESLPFLERLDVGGVLRLETPQQLRDALRSRREKPLEYLNLGETKLAKEGLEDLPVRKLDWISSLPRPMRRDRNDGLNPLDSFQCRLATQRWVCSNCKYAREMTLAPSCISLIDQSSSLKLRLWVYSLSLEFWLHR